MERRKEPERKDGEIQGQGKGEGPRGTPGTHPAPEEQPPLPLMGHSPWGCQGGLCSATSRGGGTQEEDWAPVSLSSPSPPPERVEGGGRGWQRKGHVPVSSSQEPGHSPAGSDPKHYVLNFVTQKRLKTG